MIDYTVDESSASAVLAMTGMANIQQAQKLHAALLDIAGRAQHLTLRVSGITGMDLSVLQLLCAAHRRLQRSGGGVTLDGTMPHAMREAIAAAGFVACVGENDKSGIWMGDAN